MRIAALLTCHNRRPKTLACLRSLQAAIPEADAYLTDDGSTDGTAEAVREAYPWVHIVAGDGTLYWCRGMQAAWQAALPGGYDCYLWLNDDVVLYPGCLDELMACCQWGGGACIVGGLVETADHSRIIYGGYDARRCCVLPSDEPQDIVMLNGNVVLVPAEVVGRVGTLDTYFQHDLGDVDYGLRARRQGVRVLSTRRAVAAGYPSEQCRVRRWGMTLSGRLRALRSPLGAPLDKNFYFRRRHFGMLHALAYCLRLVVLNLLPDAVVGLIWGDTYKAST